jgi:hypothetical protein
MNQKQNKLIKDIEKKCMTIMIGSLARFEKSFEHLWEIEDEKGDYYHDLWQRTRHDALNFGNHQIRDAIENLYTYFIQNKGQDKSYSYEFRFKNDQQGEKE